MNKVSAKSIALGGVMCGVAMVIMCLVGLIPVATYICPMMCCLVLQVVLSLCGSRIAWAWYAAVSLLSLLFAPDKEAAVIFVALGYYPVIKPKLERLHFPWLFKLLIFNGATCAAYALLISIMGMEALGMGDVGTALFVMMAVMGNVTFVLLDQLLKRVAHLVCSGRKRSSGR